MAQPFRSLLHSKVLQYLICAMVALYARLVYATTRWQELDDGGVSERWHGKEPLIIAHWHGRIMMLPFCWKRAEPINMLISQHQDGELIARTVAHLKIAAVRGSTSREGVTALRGLLRLLKQGHSVGITPDGPRGPRMRASDGVISLAKLSGAPIVPLTYATSRRWVANSWDRFTIALPFAHGVFVWGEPISVARDANNIEMERCRQRLEEELISITAKADSLCQVDVIKPLSEHQKQPSDTV